MTDSTLLRLYPIGIPPYSARALTQTLEPIQSAVQMRRTVNGVLTDISAEQFRLYRSTITCRDQQHPAISGIWPGMMLDVDCVVELSYEDNTDNVPEREAVFGSERTESGFVFYRPKMLMMVELFRIDRDEWGAQIGWSLDLAEVGPSPVESA